MRRLGSSYALIGAELGIGKSQARKLTHDVPVQGAGIRDITGAVVPAWTEARRPRRVLKVWT
jgi:hypothetical protein